MTMARAKKAPDPGKLRVEMMDLDEVLKRAFPGNPKAHDADALGESFSAAGYVDPIVIDETSGKNVAGHGRAEKLAAMRDAGEPPPERIEVRGKKWFVPVLRGVAFKDEATAGRYLLASNRVAELGGWDNKALAAMLSGYDGQLEGTGFSAADFAHFMTMARGWESDIQAVEGAGSHTEGIPGRIIVTCPPTAKVELLAVVKRAVARSKIVGVEVAGG